MSDNKLIDLHKVAGLFREIQNEEFAKEEVKQESEFKKTIEALETTKQEVAEEEKQYAVWIAGSKVHKGSVSHDEAEKIVQKYRDSGKWTEKAFEIRTEEVNELDAPTHESAPMGEYTDKEFACININTGEYGYCDKDELHKYTHYVPAKEFTYFDDTSGMDFADFDDEMADQEGWTKVGNPDVGDPELARLRKNSGNIDEEEISELNVPNDKAKVIARIQKLDQMADEARANDDPNKAMAIERGSEMAALHNKLEKLGGDPFDIPDYRDDWVTPEGGPLSYKKVGDYTYVVKDENGKEHKAEMGAMGDEQDNYSGDEIEQTMDQEGLQMLIRQAKMGAPAEAVEEVTEEPEMVAMDTNTLQQILNLAGLKPVTDADINQPEGEAEEVEEYSNSPDEEYADADTQLNKMSGGINRPKAMPAVGNQGHNDLVTKLKKAYDSRD